VNGILLLDKPLGLSSNAALQRVRRAYGADKAGHVGSLDPLATGMLPICLGEATKLAGAIVGGHKCYRFSIALGARTDTGDREGAVIEHAPVPQGWHMQLDAVLTRFHGRQQQVPPMYSAIKRQGQPLYKLARAGVEVERAPRAIEILSLRALPSPGVATPEPVEISFEVVCSKGTYVRSLAEDLARALGTVGHVSALRRLYVQPFEQAPMFELETLETACRAGAAPQLIPADTALPELPQVHLTLEQAARVQHGQAVVVAPVQAAGRVRLYDPSGRFMGLGETDGQGGVRPRRLYV